VCAETTILLARIAKFGPDANLANFIREIIVPMPIKSQDHQCGRRRVAFSKDDRLAFQQIDRAFGNRSMK